MAPRMTMEDLGAYFAGPDDTVWRLVTYSEHPTASLERIYPPLSTTEMVLGQRARLGGVVGSPIFDEFTRLVHDDVGADEQVARCAYPGCPSEDVELVGQTFPRTHPTLDHVAIAENVFVCPRHDRWLREDACEHVAFRRST